MSWPILILYSLGAVGAVGFCLMIAAFVMIAIRGGWQKAIQQPIADGRWPLPRRLLLAGASLATLFFVGAFILRMIAGDFSGSTPSVDGNIRIDQTTPVITSPPAEVRTRPRDDGQPTQ